MTGHGFGPHATMALHDKDRNRVTPWYPVGTDYVGEPHTTGVTIRWVGVRPWRLLPVVRWFPALVTLTGGRCTMLLPERHLGDPCRDLQLSPESAPAMGATVSCNPPPRRSAGFARSAVRSGCGAKRNSGAPVYARGPASNARHNPGESLSSHTKRTEKIP